MSGPPRAEPSAFGVLLRRYRVEADLTQEELAERARVSARAISDLERGVKQTPRIHTVRQLADALQLSGEAREQFMAAAREPALATRTVAPSTVLPVSGEPKIVPSHRTELDGDGRGAVGTSLARVALPAPAVAGRARRSTVLRWIVGIALLLLVAAGGLLAQRLSPAAKPLPPHTLLAVWGTQQIGSGAFRSPDIVRLDPSGNLFVLDQKERTILKLSPGGQLLARWTLSRPHYRVPFPIPFTPIVDIAEDRRGNLYVTDIGRDAIEKLSPTGAVVATWGGTVGINPGQFAGPTGVAVDGDGNVYVGDQGNFRVQKLSPAGKPLAQWGSKGTGPGQFGAVSGVVVDEAGNIYVADLLNNRIQKLSPGGKVLAVWGSRGSNPGQFREPNYVQLDGRGNLYVADVGNNRIQELSPAGKPLARWGTGAERFKQPTAVSVDPQGNIYVADAGHRRVEKLSPAGVVLGRWPVAALLRPLFHTPKYIAVDAGGNAYVSDAGSDSIVKLSPDGALLARWGAHGTKPGDFSFPQGVALNAGGDVYVADSKNNRIDELSPDGKLLARWGTNGAMPGQFTLPGGVAVDGHGTIYVADTGNDRVQKLSATGKPLATWTLQYQGGIVPLNSPVDVATDAHGNLYVADTGYDGVVKLTADGQPRYQWRPLSGLQAEGVAVDGRGNVYLTSWVEPYVQVFSPSGKLIASWGSLGTAPGQLRSPSGIALDGEGNVYVVDTANNRIEKFSPVRQP